MTDNKIKNEEITKKLEELLVLLKEDVSKDVKEEVNESKDVSKDVKEDVSKDIIESKDVCKDVSKCPLFKNGCPFKNKSIVEVECCKCSQASKMQTELSKTQYDELVYVESYSMLYSLLVFILLSVSMFIFFRRLFKNFNELCY